MWNKQRYCGQLHNHVWWIQNFSRRNWKIAMFGKYVYSFVVLWYGGSCKEICGAILWVGKQDDSTTLQSIYSMHRWPSFQRRRIEIRGRIVRSMLSNCSEMLILGTYWTTWYPMVSEQTCKIDHKIDKACDKRLCRLISCIHHTCDYWQYCYVGNTAQHCRQRFIQESDFAGDLADSKPHISRNSVHIRKSHVRTNKLDVQETDFSFTQFYRSWGNFSRCRFTHGWDTRSRSLGFSDWSISFLTKPNPQKQRCKRATGKLVGNSSVKHAKTNYNHEHQSRSDQCDHSPSSGTHSGSNAMLYVFEAEGPQWDMCQEPTELLWIGCLTGLIKILKFKFDTLIPNIKSQTFLTKGNFTRDEQSSSFVKHQQFQLYLLR